MKYILLLTFIFFAGCKKPATNKNDLVIKAETLLYIGESLGKEFDSLLAKGHYHISKRNMDSAFYYSGVLNYNQKVREFISALTQPIMDSLKHTQP